MSVKAKPPLSLPLELCAPPNRGIEERDQHGREDEEQRRDRRVEERRDPAAAPDRDRLSQHGAFSWRMSSTTERYDAAMHGRDPRRSRRRDAGGPRAPGAARTSAPAAPSTSPSGTTSADRAESEDLAAAVDVVGHEGQTGGRRLDQHLREPLGVAQQHQRVGPPQQRLDRLHEAQERDVVVEAGRGRRRHAGRRPAAPRRRRRGTRRAPPPAPAGAAARDRAGSCGARARRDTARPGGRRGSRERRAPRRAADAGSVAAERTITNLRDATPATSKRRARSAPTTT